MSSAERGVYELSQHQALSEASGSSFVTSQSASDMQALNDLHQQSNQASEGHSVSESTGASRTMDTGIRGQADLGIREGVGGVTGSASLGVMPV